RAVQGLHLQPRVVRDRGQAGRLGGLPRLGERVVLEGVAVLAQLAAGRDLVDRYQVEAQSGQQRNDLAQFAAVATGQNDLQRRARSSASRWRANSVCMAAAASPTSAVYCSAENASFSAVACTSTKRASPVITKLQSTSACES